MKYIIMADGEGKRWNNYGNTPKHMVIVEGERIIERTIRLIKEEDEEGEIIVTSHNPAYEFIGARRHEPLNNVLEIDRFTQELLEDDVCFLYGDTYYTETAIKEIVNKNNEDILFFGNSKSIVAVKIFDSSIFKLHFQRVRELFLKGKIDRCVGWQIYQSFEKLPFGEKKIADKFVVLTDETTDFNMPQEFEQFVSGNS